MRTESSKSPPLLGTILLDTSSHRSLPICVFYMYAGYILLSHISECSFCFLPVQEIFMFFIMQLRGLTDPEAPSFKRYFYLLEVAIYCIWTSLYLFLWHPYFPSFATCLHHWHSTSIVFLCILQHFPILLFYLAVIFIE